MSPVISKRAVNCLAGIVDAARHAGVINPVTAGRMLVELERAGKTKKFVAASRRRARAKKEDRQAEWAGVRAQVIRRSAGICENPDCLADAQEVDHMFGGGGRRKSLESVFTCWNLCSNCHRQKTNNKPNAAYWLVVFISHCATQGAECGDFDHETPAGYAHAASIAKARLSSLEAQGRVPAQKTP